MSYTTMYLVYKTKVSEVAEFNNSWGSLPALWKLIEIETGVKSPLCAFDNQDGSKFYNLYKRKDLKFSHRLCFLMTMDGAMIETDKLREASECYKEVHRDIITSGGYTWSHYEAMGENLLQLSNIKIDSRCIGVAVNNTSVSDCWIDMTKERKEKRFYVFNELHNLDNENKGAK